MLTTKSTSTSSGGQQRVKSLESQLPTAESKTPECEEVSRQKEINEASGQKLVGGGSGSGSGSAKSTPSKKNKKSSRNSPSSRRSPLSSRAAKIKKELNRKEVVKAVVLRADGSSEEISYNTSSKEVNKILGGRPTIIGEFEDIQVIIVRSLSASNKEVNQNILPVPFCNKQHRGDYLLYRVNSNGAAINLTLSEYNKFVEKNKTLTEQARKHYDPIENREIRHKSARNSQSKLTFILLRSEVDKKVRDEFFEKYKRKPNENEVENSVNATLEKLIDSLVDESSSSPMNDPDYKPDDDEKEKEKKDDDNDIIKKVQKIYSEENNGSKLSKSELTKQLKSAQKYVIEDVYGADSGDDVDESDWRLQLNDALNYVRERGRADGRLLAAKISETFYELNGAEPTLSELIGIFRRIKNELSAEATKDFDDDDRDNGSAYYLASKLGPNFSNADPSDLVDYAYRIVREDMLSRAKSSFNISKGRSPTKSELESTLNKLADKLVDEALQISVNRENEEDDADYDPNNIIDQKQKRNDEILDREFDENYFNLRMLTSSLRKSKTATKYDVYFENISSAKKENLNLEKGKKAFIMFNKREPNAMELRNLKKFLLTEKNTSLVEFKLSVISDDESNENENEDEKRETVERVKKGPTTPSKVLVTPVKKKKSSSLRYDVYLNDKFDDIKNEKIAIKWFNRFNNRKPTNEEQVNIKNFIKSDKSALTVCNFDIEIDSAANDDDKKDTEESDKINMNMKMKTNNIVNKGKRSTKYTLNFDGDNEQQIGDEKQAIKWFKIFNNRSPNNDEIQKIQLFVKEDANKNKNIKNEDDNKDTIDID